MKPITEHPEFDLALANYFPKGKNRNPYVDYSLNDMESAYCAGAEAAQSILQKQHDSEMEAFAEWIKEKIENCDIELGLSEYWRMEEHELNSKQLLQLFRERDKQ